MQSPMRRVLRRLGPTWLASPWRRLIQAACFALFFWLLLYVAWPYTVTPPSQADASTEAAVAEADVDAPEERPWPDHYAKELESKEIIAAESFLAMDPLVSISTAIASRTWVWSLAVAGVVLAVCLLVPRGFCAYVCPMGTLIDLFDWAVGRWFKAVHGVVAKRIGVFSQTKFGVLALVLITALFGVTLTGYFAPIPILTRGVTMGASPVQLGLARSFGQVPPIGKEHLLAIAMVCGILALGVLAPRFWCRYLCPSGAIFSLANMLRLTNRKVKHTCIGCKRCVQVCPFDAIEQEGFDTRGLECTYCQTCGGACPVRAIEFGPRLASASEPTESKAVASDEKSTPPCPTSRRRFLATGGAMIAGATSGVVAAPILRLLTEARDAFYSDNPPPIVRAPGTVPEEDFLKLCTRCGECLQACPNNVLQPIGSLHGPTHYFSGWEDFWTPYANLNHSGCEPSCNICGHVCPTSAIRPLPLEEKKVARMGLAVINEKTCLPYAGVDDCDICLRECQIAGYNAITMRPVIPDNVTYDEFGQMIDEFGQLVADTALNGPVVNADLCVGCGICQSRCNHRLVEAERKLDAPAVIVIAGEGNEDRIMSGSYRKLRDDRKAASSAVEETLVEESPAEDATADPASAPDDGFELPNFLDSDPTAPTETPADRPAADGGFELPDFLSE